MVSLEQIRKLEQKVHAAVSRITVLDKENRALRSQVAEYERRLGELQQLVDAFKHDQDEIEAGIVSVLKHLDQLEDRVGDPEEISGPSQAEKPHQAPSHQNAAAAEEHAAEPAAETADPQPPEADSPDDGREDPDEEEPELDIF